MRQHNNTDPSQIYNRRYATSITWLSFFKWVGVVIGVDLILYMLFNFHVLSIFFLIIFAYWAYVRIRSQRQMDRFNELIIPGSIWQAFSKLHPELSPQQHQMIAEGFKDYLAIHLLNRRSYAMPSHAVDALWHILLEQFPHEYRQLCLTYLGFELQHAVHVSKPTVQQKGAYKRQLLATWQYSAQLHRIPLQSHRLPRLFKIDQSLKWQGGLIFSMVMIQSFSAEVLRMNQHSSVSSSNDSGSGSTSDGLSYSNTSSDCGDSSGSDGSGSDSSCSSSSCSSCGSSGD